MDRPSPTSVFLVSDHVSGWRLSHVLERAERDGLTLDISAVLSLLRQLIPAVALFARHQRDLAVGTIAPERLILTPQGRLLITEYALGEALEKLALTREYLWRHYRVAVASIPGEPREGPRSDVLGIGLVALALLFGRRLRDDDFPEGLESLLENATESSGGTRRPIASRLANWLARALQLDPATALSTPQDAQVAFEEMLAAERGYVTTPLLLDEFIKKFGRTAGPPAEPLARPMARRRSGVRPPAEPVPPPPPPPPPAPTPTPEPPVRSVAERQQAPVAPPAAGGVARNKTAFPDRVPAREPRPTPPTRKPPAKAPSVYLREIDENMRRDQQAAATAAAAEQPIQSGAVGGAPPVADKPEMSVFPSEVDAKVKSDPTESVAPPIADVEQSAAQGKPAAGWLRPALAGLGIVAVIEAALILSLWNRGAATLANEGELVIQSRPAAAKVTLDEKDLGATPVTVRLAPGAYTVKVQVGSSEPRVIVVQIRAGVQTVQYLELQPANKP
jgi:hypothetical protein